MKTQDWLYIGLAALGGLLLVVKKSFPDSNYIIQRLQDAPDSLLPVKPTETNLKVMAYADYIWSNAIAFNIDPSIIAGIIETESSGNPLAVRQEPIVKDYSVGLMQVLTGTAGFVKSKYPQIAYNGDPKQLNIPSVNIQVGTAYLRYQLNRYMVSPVIKPITDMIAAYNAGTARRNDPSDFVYVNSKGSTIVQNYVDKVVEKAYRYQFFFTYLYTYDLYIAKFPPGFWQNYTYSGGGFFK